MCSTLMWELLENLGFSSRFYSTALCSLPYPQPAHSFLASVYSFISISRSAFTFGFSGQNKKLNRQQVRQQSATRCDFRSSFRFLSSFSLRFSFATAGLIALGRWLEEWSAGSCATATACVSVCLPVCLGATILWNRTASFTTWIVFPINLQAVCHVISYKFVWQKVSRMWS